MTIIKLFGVKDPYIVKESYPTIKRRIYTSELFFEVTVGGQKLTINKTNVEEVGDIPKKTIVSHQNDNIKKKLKKGKNE